jgi:homoserine dehydrogenase
MKKVRIGLAGLGTVGSGVMRLIRANSGVIEQKTGLQLEVSAILDLDFSGKEALIPPTCVATTSMEEFEDTEQDITVELIGGTNVARKVIEGALAAGRGVVTANKALLAEQGQELFSLANGQKLRYEAAVAGAIPVVQSLQSSLTQNNIIKIDGILNGTSNYILTRMFEERLSYEEILPEAQRLGYAEADAGFDVDGIDAAHKLALLANLAYSSYVPFASIFVQGIRDIKVIDIEMADRLGYMIKPLGIAKIVDGHIEVRVHPTMIPKSHPLSTIRLENNGVFYDTDYSGEGSLTGKGAGSLPTGSAVVADIIQLGLQNTNPLPFTTEQKYSIAEAQHIQSRFYLRVMTQDRPGVLAKISGILGDHDISLASVMQLESNTEIVPLTMVSHKANEQSMMDALMQVKKIPEISAEEVVLLHIEE